MEAFSIHTGGMGALGQTTTVTASNVINEVQTRGYSEAVHHVPIEPHVPAPAQITKNMAINVAIDEAIVQLGLPRTSTHYYRCPTGACPVPSGSWNVMIPWCVRTANGYLNQGGYSYALPPWASSMLHGGALHGVPGFGRISGLGGFSDWLQENPWFVATVGDAISNYGDYLTAKNVQDAIKANTDQQLSKDDAMELIAKLQAGGFIPAGKTETATKGALATAGGISWQTIALLGGGALLIMMVMKK